MIQLKYLWLAQVLTNVPRTGAGRGGRGGLAPTYIYGLRLSRR